MKYLLISAVVLGLAVCAFIVLFRGSVDTTIGRNFYPKASDMREGNTQSLTDGEIFYIITNAELEEMRGLNPVSRGHVTRGETAAKHVHHGDH